jgi:hypothetical protein
MLHGSRKEIEVLNIKEHYVTKYGQHSSHEINSQNDLSSPQELVSPQELINFHSPHSSNHSDKQTPKAFYEKEEDEVLSRSKLEHL